MIRYIGNKRGIAHKIIPYFPKHDIYIEPFGGVLGMFLSKPLAKYNFINDIDAHMINLFLCVKSKKEELLDAWENEIMHQIMFDKYKKSISDEWEFDINNPNIEKAVEVLYLHTYSYLSQCNTFEICIMENRRKMCKNHIENAYYKIKNACFENSSYKKFFISLVQRVFLKNSFIYADPPYINTAGYRCDTFTEQDCIDLFELLIKTGCKFAYSEFDNPIILDIAKQFKLKINVIGERRTLNNRNTEILITNYEPEHLLF